MPYLALSAAYIVATFVFWMVRGRHYRDIILPQAQRENGLVDMMVIFHMIVKVDFPFFAMRFICLVVLIIFLWSLKPTFGNALVALFCLLALTLLGDIVVLGVRSLVL